MVSRIGRAKGFTLLETLVAFTILALSLGVILQLFGQGFRTADSVKQYTLASIWSQSLVARLDVDIPLQPGLHRGETEDGFRWQLQIKTLKPAKFESNVPPAYEVLIDVSWGENETVSLNTVRLGQLL